METSSILLAFVLTMIAGLSTGVGSLIAFFAKRTNTKFLSAALGFSAGVMVYISFMELMPEALGMLGQQMSPRMAHICMLAAFFAGTSFIALIDFLIPEDENPHEIHRVEELSDTRRLQRTGVLMALAIGIHNFPEGLATFASALGNLDIAIPIVVAIAIHNIPRRHSRVGTHLPGHGQPQESLLVLALLGSGRAGRGPHRLPLPAPPSGPPSSTPCCWPSSRVSWSSSRSTNCCPAPRNTAITTTA